jgi:peptidyl-prolyl cis-trans isomerase SurA
MFNKNYCFVFFSILLSLNGQAQQARTLDKIIAVVDEFPILLSDIEIQKAQIKENTIDTHNIDCKILQQLVIGKMFAAQAQIDSLPISDDEINGELERRMRYFISVFGGKDKLENHYGKTVEQLKTDFRDDVREQLLSERMKNKITQGISPTPSEVKTYFKTIPSDSLPYFNTEVQLAQIAFIPKAGKEQKLMAREKLESIRQDILSGKSEFTTQAVLYSDDPGSATNGGHLGIISRGELVPEFEAVAYRLEAGAISELVETKFGFHLIQTLEKMGEKIKVRHILVSPRVSMEDYEKAAILADTVLAKIKSGRLSFEKAVKDYSDDENTKNSGGMIQNQRSGTTYFEMSEIESSLSFVVDKLEVGNVSDVLPFVSQEGKKGFRIVKLFSQSAPHKASLEKDYTKIKNAAMQTKQQAVVAKWVKDKKEDMYIRIDKSFQRCDLFNLK